MADNHDDLDAIRTIVDALTPFDPEEQKRIVRWAFEKIGLEIGATAPAAPSSAPLPPAVPPTPVAQQTPASIAISRSASNPDIKSFVAAKSPANDMQFAATIAYFYAFDAIEEQKKAEVGPTDLQEACRLTGRERLANPGQTLRNAAYNGLLDKGSEKGTYKINTVGENLVALTLPAGAAGVETKTARKRSKKKPATKKTSKKAQKKGAKKTAKKTGQKS